MIKPSSFEELANYVEKGKNVFFFTAKWCGDCVFIKPKLPEIEQLFPDYTFVEVDRDAYLEVCQTWHVIGIPSFVVIEDGKEKGRFVSKNRKTKEDIVAFLQTL